MRSVAFKRGCDTSLRAGEVARKMRRTSKCRTLGVRVESWPRLQNVLQQSKSLTITYINPNNASNDRCPYFLRQDHRHAIVNLRGRAFCGARQDRAGQHLLLALGRGPRGHYAGEGKKTIARQMREALSRCANGAGLARLMPKDEVVRLPEQTQSSAPRALICGRHPCPSSGNERGGTR
jgi:hypothetical protein